MRRALARPELLARVRDPEVQAALSEVAASPWKVVKHLFNPKVMGALKVGAGRGAGGGGGLVGERAPLLRGRGPGCSRRRWRCELRPLCCSLCGACVRRRGCKHQGLAAAELLRAFLFQHRGCRGAALSARCSRTSGNRVLPTHRRCAARSRRPGRLQRRDGSQGNLVGQSSGGGAPPSASMTPQAEVTASVWRMAEYAARAPRILDPGRRGPGPWTAGRRAARGGTAGPAAGPVDGSRAASCRL
jgi:hypothetical protein